MRYYSLWLGLVIVGIFIIQLIVPGFTDALLLTRHAWSEPWRFLTAIFMHAGVSHLLYNLFALLLFGFILEKIIGSRRFLFVFLISGLGANLLSVFFYDSALGASGAIFGIIGTLTFLRPLMTVWAFSLPMPLFLASILWVIGDILGVFFPSGVANLAHLAGLGIGLIMGALYYSNFRENKLKRNRIEIPEDYMRAWEDSYMR